MSTFCWLGHSHAAPASVTTPMAISSPTTILAASGPNGDGPLRECEWACECVTRNRVEAVLRLLLPVTDEEVTQPLDGVGQIAGPGQRHNAQVVGCRPVEAGALGDQNLLLHQQ